MARILARSACPSLVALNSCHAAHPGSPPPSPTPAGRSAALRSPSRSFTAVSFCSCVPHCVAFTDTSRTRPLTPSITPPVRSAPTASSCLAASSDQAIVSSVDRCGQRAAAFALYCSASCSTDTAEYAPCRRARWLSGSGGGTFGDGSGPFARRCASDTLTPSAFAISRYDLPSLRIRRAACRRRYFRCRAPSCAPVAITAPSGLAFQSFRLSPSRNGNAAAAPGRHRGFEARGHPPTPVAMRDPDGRVKAGASHRSSPAPDLVDRRGLLTREERLDRADRVHPHRPEPHHRQPRR